MPHSEISGSKLAYSSPEHIGVRSVLHRLLVPRHPPCALGNLIFTVVDKLRISLSAALSHILTHIRALRCSFGCLLELLASRQPWLSAFTQNHQRFYTFLMVLRKRIIHKVNDSRFVSSLAYLVFKERINLESLTSQNRTKRKRLSH